MLKSNYQLFRLHALCYVKAKHLLRDHTASQSKDHLQTLSVQSKFKGSAELEESCKTWNRLLSGFHPGQIFFLLRAASDTLPTAVLIYRDGLFSA